MNKVNQKTTGVPTGISEAKPRGKNNKITLNPYSPQSSEIRQAH